MSQNRLQPDNRVILEARQIGRRTADERAWLLQNLSLSIAVGERVAVVGASGSGKTVLLRSLALLDPLDTGELLWYGKTVDRDMVPRYRSHVVYLHQRPALVEGTVLDNLTYPFQFAIHRDRHFDRRQIEHWLQVLGRDASFLDKRSRDLSGGEMQITALLRAVQFEPEILLLDEPTAALDQATTQAVEQCVRQWQNERRDKRSFVVVSHNTEQVERMVDRTIQMSNGEVVAGG
jgi:putative ABC transport system ATP-binding protein